MAPARSFFLFGPRGSGKSTWLRQEFGDAIWVDLLEESRYQSYLANPALFAQVLEGVPVGSWVVVDEIQRLPNLLNEVHRFIESDKKLKFALSGSSSRKLKRAGVNLLAGRATRRFMEGLLPEELGNDFDLETVLRFGSLPLIWQAEDRVEALQDYAQLYLREEIQAEAIVRNLPAFARFLPIAALCHGQIISIASLARDAEAHRTTIQGYVDILEDTLLAFRLPAFETKLRIKEKRHPKLYFVDPGIVRSLKKNLYPVAAEEYGHLFEGWFVNYLRTYNFYQPIFDEISYWAVNETKLEVDIILAKGNEKVAIEIKSAPRLRKEDFEGLKAIAELQGLKRRILVYGGAESRHHDGIEIIPISQFLRQQKVRNL